MFEEVNIGFAWLSNYFSLAFCQNFINSYLQSIGPFLMAFYSPSPEYPVACRSAAEIPLVEDAACGAGLQG